MSLTPSLTAEQVAALPRKTREEMLVLLEERERRKSQRKIWTYFPDTGPLRRELYQKHLEFFRAGREHRRRAAMCANRVGKTETMGLYETTLHLIGIYPPWWEGRRFNRPIRAWVCGQTAETVRDILQRKLLGAVNEWGTGLIPHECIAKRSDGSLHITRAMGVSDAVDTIHVQHSSGGISECSLKSYRRGESSFPGTDIDVAILDEEAPLGITTECLVRTMTNDGMIIQTFTPLLGMTPAVLNVLPDGDWRHLGANGSRYVVMAGWDDVPHLTESAKREMLEGIPPFQRDARSKGIPQLGAGAIYPIPESEIAVAEFEIPNHWPRWYGMDVGWNRTAVGWYALNRDSGVRYRYSEHYVAEEKPPIHAAAIKSRGEWIRGVLDPAARGRSQEDGRQLIQTYRDLGLDLTEADNAVEAGLYEVWTLLSTGQLKIFKSSCPNFFAEYRLYHRDSKGKIVKSNDHVMDECRYSQMSGLAVARTKPLPPDPMASRSRQYTREGRTTGWMNG